MICFVEDNHPSNNNKKSDVNLKIKLFRKKSLLFIFNLNFFPPSIHKSRFSRTVKKLYIFIKIFLIPEIINENNHLRQKKTTVNGSLLFDDSLKKYQKT